MADDTTLGAAVGVGDKISTDDLGAGTKVQRVKAQFGADGSATDVSSANPLPTVQTGALPAGANAIGKLAANSGVDIGDVDVTSSALPTGASTSAKQPALGTAGTASTDVLTVQGIAAMTALKVDGSGVTQPVSGTVTASGPLTDTQLRASAVPVSLASAPSTAVTNAGTFAVQIAANSSVNVAQVAGTATAVNSGSLSAGVQRVTLATDQVQLTNALKVDGSAVTQPISATNLSTNMAQVAGTTTDTNSGSKSAGTQRVVIATDQPALTNALKVDGSAVTQPISGSVTVLAVGGTVAVGGSVGLTAGSSSNGYTPVFYAAQTTSVQTVKGSSGVIGGWMIYNPNASVAYVQIFNTTGAVTLGTTVPLMSLPIPAASAANMPSEVGLAFSTGIKLACTTTALGLTAPGTGLDVNIFFK